jgi:hypothetical protein
MHSYTPLNLGTTYAIRNITDQRAHAHSAGRDKSRRYDLLAHFIELHAISDE